MHHMPPSTASGLGDSTNSGLRPLLTFIRHPVFASSARGRLTVRRWLGWVSLLLLLCLLSGAFDKALVLAFHWSAAGHSAWTEFMSHPSWPAAAVLAASPALEELGFRAFLSTAPRFVFTGLAVFPAYVYIFIHNNVVRIISPIPPGEVFTAYLHAFWVALAAGAVSLLLVRYRRDAVLGFFRRRAGWVFWASCIVFAAGHNLLYSNSLIWWGFLLVLPQFVAGIGLAYLRASFGLRWSIASHYAIDMLTLLPSWLYFSASAFGPMRGALLTLATLVLAALLAGMVYGVVALRHVAQFRW